MVIAMPAPPRTAKDIFVELVAAPRASWGEQLDEACEGDEALRARVQALLRRHDEPGSFLDQPAVAEPRRRSTHRWPKAPAR